jgi:hypothetical protein
MVVTHLAVYCPLGAQVTATDLAGNTASIPSSGVAVVPTAVPITDLRVSSAHLQGLPWAASEEPLYWGTDVEVEWRLPAGFPAGMVRKQFVQLTLSVQDPVAMGPVVWTSQDLGPREVQLVVPFAELYRCGGGGWGGG